ncbi:hypothetical protein D4M48_16325 [Escherichia coli]|nr:hypothetical protein D4M48_16325 [Escherichia coli]
MNIRRKDKHTNYAPDFQGAQSRELLSLNQEDLLWECRMPLNCTPNVGHNLTSEGAVYETFI